MFSIFRDRRSPTSTAPSRASMSETSDIPSDPPGWWDVVYTASEQNENRDPGFTDTVSIKMTTTKPPSGRRRITSSGSILSDDFDTITDKIKTLTENPTKLHRDILARRGRRAIRELGNADRRISDETIDLVMGALAGQAPKDYICLNTDWRYVRGSDLDGTPLVYDSNDGNTPWVVAPVKYPSICGPHWTLAIIDPYHNVCYAYDPVADSPRPSIRRISLANLIKSELGLSHVEIRQIQGPQVMQGVDFGVTRMLCAAKLVLSPTNREHHIQRTRQLQMIATPRKARSDLLRLVSEHYQIDEHNGTPVVRNLMSAFEKQHMNRRPLARKKITKKTTPLEKQGPPANPDIADAESLLREVRRLGTEADALMREAEEKREQAEKRYKLVDVLLEDAATAARRASDGSRSNG